MSRRPKIAELRAGMKPDRIVPVYYIARDLVTPRATLVRGQLWEHQNKAMIRGWSESYGVPDDGRPWHELDFVQTVIAPTWEVADAIVAQGLTYDQARAHVDRWLEERVA
jgi:hypothetical protein